MPGGRPSTPADHLGEPMTNVDSDTGVLAGEQRMLIDGELRYTDSGALFDVVHPASEQVAGRGHRRNGDRRRAGHHGGAPGLRHDRLVARRRFPPPLPAPAAGGTDRRTGAAAPHRHHRGGLSVSVTGSQIESPIAEVGHWVEHGRAFDYLVDTGVHETPLGPARRKIQYDPVGVVGAITP